MERTRSLVQWDCLRSCCIGESRGELASAVESSAPESPVKEMVALEPATATEKS